MAVRRPAQGARRHSARLRKHSQDVHAPVHRGEPREADAQNHRPGAVSSMMAPQDTHAVWPATRQREKARPREKESLMKTVATMCASFLLAAASIVAADPAAPNLAIDHVHI